MSTGLKYSSTVGTIYHTGKQALFWDVRVSSLSKSWCFLFLFVSEGRFSFYPLSSRRKFLTTVPAHGPSLELLR